MEFKGNIFGIPLQYQCDTIVIRLLHETREQLSVTAVIILYMVGGSVCDATGL